MGTAMTLFMKTARLAAASSLFALTACGGGGGASSSGGSSSGSSSSGGSTTPNVSIGAPDPVQVNPLASPAFNFSNNLPPVGTVFPVIGPAAQFNSTTVIASGIGNTATATYKGTVSVSGASYMVVDLNIPALGVSASNLVATGAQTTLGDGSKVGIAVTELNYTLLGIWTDIAPSGAHFIGVSVDGSGTPQANIPTTGSATYSRAGGVAGFYYVPSGTGTISPGSLSGDVSLTANFGTGAVNGTFTNMMAATPATGGSVTPWNNVTLAGNISGTTFNGTTTVSAAPANAGIAGFSTAATGNFKGAFFGPNADEAAGTWSITEPNASGGGKTAYGAFGGHQ